MKKFTLLLVNFLVLSFYPYAHEINVQQAKKVALNFYFEKYNQFERQVMYDQFAIQSVYTETDGIQNFYYVFQINQGGFVMVSADDCLMPVLGYSFKQNFVAENQPPNVQYWFSQYKDQVIYARKNQIKSEKETVDKWEYYLNNNVELVNNLTKNREVEPLITTLWDQDFPFNLHCPPNTNTGCHATALAQIAYYWRWPDHGQGYTAYIPATHPEYGLQTADYENTWYRFNEMVDDPGTPNFAIAEYIYHFSAALHSDFSTGNTFPDSIFMLNHQAACDSIACHFKFDALQFYYRDSMPEIDWENLLTGMLDTKCPIFYAGYRQYPTIGHFLCVMDTRMKNIFTLTLAGVVQMMVTIHLIIFLHIIPINSA